MSNGVEIAGITDSTNAVKTVYDPSHPDADADGFVQMPNINLVEEMVGMVTASKAYEANAVAAGNAKKYDRSGNENLKGKVKREKYI